MVYGFLLIALPELGYVLTINHQFLDIHMIVFELYIFVIFHEILRAKRR
jgi:hypothetical protein